MATPNTKPPSLPPTLVRLLLVIGLLLILPHIGNLKPIFIAAGLILLTWRASTLKFPRLLPNKWVLAPLSIGLGLLVLKSFGMSLGPDASSSLLIILLGLKLLECKTPRDVQAVIYLCFFLLITPFLFDQRIEIAIYALGIFFMLLFALTINNTQANTLKNSPLIRLSGTVLLQAIPLMLIFFIFFPRMIGPLWAMPDESSAISGVGDTINPGAISNLALSDETAFRVRFNSKPPEQKNLYWRGPVFWDTDGRTWKHGLSSSAAKTQETAGILQYQYTLMMEPHQQLWLYGLDTPISAPKGARLTSDKQLLLKKKLSRNISFDITSSPHLNNTALSKNDKERALAIPANTDLRVIDLAKRWQESSGSPRDIVNKALQFYNSEFYYTLRPPSLGKNPVAEFLFETKRGFCGHFATSFATLMRAANIPAKLVAGYQGGVYNKIGDFYNIRQADAHVWVEVWDGNSWIRVDPTAAIAPNRIEHSVNASLQQINGNINFLITPPDGLKKWVRQLTWAMHSIDYYWQSAVLAYGPEKQLEFLSNVGITKWGDMVIWLASLSGLILLVSASFLLYIQRQRHDPLQKSYLSLCKKLSKKTGERQQHETTSDYFEHVIQQRPDLSNELSTLRTQYLNARYGNADAANFIASAKKIKI
ncbi:MAG: DUF3488 domain-containing transglutaminase family protein [Cycloclasticus sp.]|nr:DUF3488 domain-containing transglutaminase family protein [Cycloclasticus sp.]